MKREDLIKRRVLFILGVVFIILGLIYIFNALRPLTGFIVADNINQTESGLIGVGFISAGILFFSMSKKKKGQAAMEFLFTYGWTIMAAVVAVGVLAFMGVFGTSSLFGSSTTAILSAPFYVEAAAVSVDGSSISLQIKNSGESKTIQSLSISGCSTYSTPTPIGEDGKVSITITCSSPIKGKIKGDIVLTWAKTGSSLTQSSTGSFSGQVSDVSTQGQSQQTGSDTTPPVISLVDVNGISTPPYTLSTNTITVSATTNENANCKWDNNDLSYSSMANNACNGAGSTSHVCTSPALNDGTYDFYVSCVDGLSNENIQVNNLDVVGIVISTTPNPVCGNGITESGESCDGMDLTQETCATQGYVGGTLACKIDCTYDFSQCTNQPIDYIAYWDFNEGSGTTASDKSANANTGTLQNGAAWAVGHSGNAVSLDGVNDFIKVVDSPSLNPSSAISFSAWIYPTSSTGGMVFAKGSDGSQFYARIVNSHVRFSLAATSYEPIGYTLQLNTWSHVAGTYDGALIRVYVNGIEMGTPKSTSTSLPSSTTELDIGRRTPPNSINPFNGRIDELKIYSRALSANEVAQLAV